MGPLNPRLSSAIACHYLYAGTSPFEFNIKNMTLNQ